MCFGGDKWLPQKGQETHCSVSSKTLVIRKKILIPVISWGGKALGSEEDSHNVNSGNVFIPVSIWWQTVNSVITVMQRGCISFQLAWWEYLVPGITVLVPIVHNGGLKTISEAKSKEKFVKKEKLFLTHLFSLDATNPYHVIIAQCCIEYLVNILRFLFMNTDGNALHVYC